MRERGQASIEAICTAGTMIVVVAGILQAILTAGARQQALRVAEQAAVAVAEGRPIPQRLRHDAAIEVKGNVVRVTVHGFGLPGLPGIEAHEQAVVP
jgi:hypothetical protein